MPPLRSAEALVPRGGGHAGRQAAPVAAQAGFAGVQDCFEQQGELLQGDVHQLPCEQTLAVTVGGRQSCRRRRRRRDGATRKA